MTIPKVSVPEVAPGQDAALYLNSLTDQSVVAAYMDFYVAGLGLPPDDPELVELIRLRNGVAQSCQYCLSVRLEGGDGLGHDIAETVVRFEESELPDRQKAALRLATAFLEVPSRLTPDVRDEALKHFSSEEIVGLMLRLTSFLVNKPRAALGVDGPLDPRGPTSVHSDAVEKFIPQN